MSRRFLHDSRYFAPVAPVSVLLALEFQNVLPSYNLILSHNVVEREKSFEVLVKQTTHGVWHIDNSVIELGKPVEAHVIAEAWKIIHYAGGARPAKEVVCILPDALLDGPQTVEVARAALIEF